MRLSNRVKILSFVAVFAVVGSAYLAYTHAATDTTTTTDVAVTDPSMATLTDSVLDDPSTVNFAPASCAAQATIPVTSLYGGDYWLNPDRYGGGTQCPQNTDGKTDFKVVSGGVPQPNTGAVQAFPNIIKGCTTKVCVPGSGFPKQVAGLTADPRATVTANTAGVAGEWDFSIDMWFNKYDVVGPSKGAEILIMLNAQNKPFPNVARTLVSIDGVNWWRLHYVQSNAGNTWNFIEYRRASVTNSASQLQLKPFMTNAAAIGQMSTGWYITGIDTGFEIWGGGLGLSLSGLTIAGI